MHVLDIYRFWLWNITYTRTQIESKKKNHFKKINTLCVLRMCALVCVCVESLWGFVFVTVKYGLNINSMAEVLLFNSFSIIFSPFLSSSAVLLFSLSWIVFACINIFGRNMLLLFKPLFVLDFVFVLSFLFTRTYPLLCTSNTHWELSKMSLNFTPASPVYLRHMPVTITPLITKRSSWYGLELVFQCHFRFSVIPVQFGHIRDSSCPNKSR